MPTQAGEPADRWPKMSCKLLIDIRYACCSVKYEQKQRHKRKSMHT